MKVSLVLSLLMLAAQSAHAKCAPDFHIFSGVVTNKAGMPLPGAMVGISWSEHDGPAGPVLAATDKNGRYTIPVLFDTYSGKGNDVEDECMYRVEVISMSAFKGALRSPYVKVPIGREESVRVGPAVIWLELDNPTLVRMLKRSNR